jgi:hypothetical protein
VKSRASSSDIQQNNRVLKDFASFFFFGFVDVGFGIDSVWVLIQFGVSI